ncbi:hypothetical protein [Kitasatospora sp. NBC_00039]|uniref:hypothetical protein n=1 Tax=Kitasatospora sp. NBC_00039 TaxID=2903565 RepID=UPI00324D99F8
MDLDALVGASELFTPADIEYAARVAAQAAFERDLTTPDGVADGVEGASTADYLAAIGQAQPTVTPPMIGSSARTSRPTPGCDCRSRDAAVPETRPVPKRCHPRKAGNHKVIAV